MSEEKDGTLSESYVEICHCCDMGVTLPTSPDPAVNYRRPRCGAVLIRAKEYSFHTVGTIALSALIMLFASLTQSLAQKTEQSALSLVERLSCFSGTLSKLSVIRNHVNVHVAWQIISGSISNA